MFCFVFFQSGIKLLAYIFYDNTQNQNRTSRALLRRELLPVAKRYRGYVDFVTIDGVEYGHVATSLLELNRPDRSSSSLFPAFVVHSLFNDQVFVYDDAPITAAGVDRFVLDILQGKMSSSSGRGKDEGKVNKNDHDEL